MCEVPGSLSDWVAGRAGGQDQDPLEGWADCSEHRCKLCGHTAWSNLRFHWHVKREHGIASTKQYRTQHGDPEVSWLLVYSEYTESSV